MSEQAQNTPINERRSADVKRPLVLVVDPNETTRSVLEVALARDGFDVWSSSRAEKAFELLKQGRVPDVVVLESELGEEDGFSFVAQLRGDVTTGHVPVLLLASAEQRNVEALAEVVGIDQYIKKPAYARDVVALVRVEHARRSNSKQVSFHAQQLAPVQLLRALLSSPRQGKLVLANGRAHIAFRNGRIVSVRFDGQSSAEALIRAVALTTGEYRLVLENIDGLGELQVGVRELVGQVMPRISRWAQVQSQSLPLDAKLMIDFNRLAAVVKTLPDAASQVSRLFDGFRSVHDVVIDSPFDESLTLEIARRLAGLGVIIPARERAQSGAGLTAPALFEPKAPETAELMKTLFAEGSVPLDTGAHGEEHDWFEEPHGTGLDVTDPAGGWASIPAPEVLTGLPKDMQTQLEAFNIRFEVEPPEPAQAQPPAQLVAPAVVAAPVASLVAESADEPTPPLGHRAHTLAMERAAQLAMDERFVDDEPTQTHRAMALPTVTPAIAESDEPATVVEARSTPATVGAAAVGAANTPHLPQTHVAPVDSLEASFFEPDVTPALSAADSEVTQTFATQPRRERSRSIAPWVGLGLGVVAVAVLIESTWSKAPSAAAPSPTPVVAVPVVAAPEPVPVPVEEPVAEAPAIDVSENLKQANDFYFAGEYRKALSVLEQVLIDAPTSVDGWLLDSMVRFDAGDVAGSRKSVAKVLELDPKNARVHILIATIANSVGDREGSQAALEKYLELAPNGPEADEARKLLKR